MMIPMGLNKVFAQNDEGFVYKVADIEIIDNDECMTVYLELEGAWDEGEWRDAGDYPDNIQYQEILCHFFEEGIKEALEDEGYILTEDNLELI